MDEQQGRRTTEADWKRARMGDATALAAIVAEFDRPLLHLAERLCGNRDDALDIRQQAWIRAMRGLDRFDGRSPLGPWLMQIVINLCRDRARSQRRAPVSLEGEAPLMDAEVEPRERAAQTEAGDRVRAAVLALPQEEREVLVLYHYHKLSLVEMVELLGRPRSTLQSMLVRILRKLRGHLRPFDPQQSDEPSSKSRRIDHAM